MVMIKRSLALATVLVATAAFSYAATAQTLSPDQGTATTLPTAPNFSVTVDGVPFPTVIGVEGLAHEVVEYKDPEDMTTRYRPGNNKSTRIKLTREWANDSAWLNAVDATEKPTRKTITVTILSRSAKTPPQPTIANSDTLPLPGASSFNLSGCWPAAWNGPSFKSLGSAHAVESLTFICDTIEIDHAI